MQARFHRADGHPEDLGDLLLRQVLDVMQDHHRPEVLGDLQQGTLDVDR
jgi:hypothetical protein